jgi:hypothetical protein
MSVIGWGRVLDEDDLDDRLGPDERVGGALWGDSPAETRERAIKGAIRLGMPRRHIEITYSVSPNTIARLRREMAEAERAPLH